MIKEEEKKLVSYFCQLRRLLLDQSSSVQPLSESSGGTLSVTEKSGRRTDGQKTEILVSNIGWSGHTNKQTKGPNQSIYNVHLHTVKKDILQKFIYYPIVSYTVYRIHSVQRTLYPVGYSLYREDAPGLTKPGKTSLRVLESRTEWHLGNSIGFGVLLSHQHILNIEVN